LRTSGCVLVPPRSGCFSMRVSYSRRHCRYRVCCRHYSSAVSCSSHKRSLRERPSCSLSTHHYCDI
jgi:hypothetical protein